MKQNGYVMEMETMSIESAGSQMGMVLRESFTRLNSSLRASGRKLAERGAERLAGLPGRVELAVVPAVYCDKMRINE